MKIWSSQWLLLSNCKGTRKKFPDCNEIRIHGLYVGAAALYQLSNEDPYFGINWRPIYWVYLNPWMEWNMEWRLCEVRKYNLLPGVRWTQRIGLLQCMALQSSVGRALQRCRRGHGFESLWSPECFLINFQFLRLLYHYYDHIFI